MKKLKQKIIEAKYPAPILREIKEPVRLADVFLAFEKQRKLVGKRLWLTSKGYLNYTSFDYETMYAQAVWDLTKDLDGQSKEVKKFLEDILI